MIILLLGIMLISVGCSHGVNNLRRVESELAGEGTEGWIHGASEQLGTYVFTHRDPKDFFNFINISLVPADAQIRSQLNQLHRHDFVKVKGKFLQNSSPQKHILVKALEVLAPYQPDPELGKYNYRASLPDDLVSKQSADFLVHSISEDGHILVVEYRDAILPIFVKNPELTQGLYRNDLVELKFSMQSNPSRPIHLRLNELDSNPIVVQDSIHKLHHEIGAIEGPLVMFPKSPDILFNVFAIQQELPNGLKRYFTLVNFENKETFKQIRSKLQISWDKHPKAWKNDRNKLVSTKIRVKAKGVFNIEDHGQANPQILMKSASDLLIFE